MKRVVVVGGGPGGLTAAMLLQSRGFQVTVIEKRAALGGRSGGMRIGPYTFDVGSTMLMMPFVLEEMFELAGRAMADELHLIPIDPMYRLDFTDRALDIYSDTTRMREELHRFDPGSEEGLARFLAREHERLAHLFPVLQQSWPTLASLVTPSVVAALPHVGLTRSIHTVASDYFDDPDLQLGFSFQSAYLGMSPWDCPGGFGLVPYVEHAWGLHHVEGGIHRISEALARVARQAGATVRTGVEVRHLHREGDRVVAVELDTGERVPTDAVVVNADATQALLGLLDDDVSVRFRRDHLRHLDESCSTWMLYLGLDRLVPLHHHTFFFADDYRSEMDRVFRRGTLDDDLSLYVCNPSVTDSTMAPAGCSSLYVLALVPNTRSSIDWKQETATMRDRVLRMLTMRSGFDVTPHVQAEAILTPTDWEREYNVSHGAVFGPTHNIGQLLAFRMPNRLPSPHNVYLTGGGTNPGSGLPTILESGRIVTRLLCEEYGIEFPPSRPLPEPATWKRIP
jgi:phytoene desaturase